MLTRISALILLAVVSHAQPQPGPALSVDVKAERHPISPDIYGFNWTWDKELDSDNTAAAGGLRLGVRRLGGNNTSRYNWKLDVSNIDADWFFEVLPDTSTDATKLPDGSSFNKMVDYSRRTGAKVMGTIPILGWLPKARQRMCSFSVTRYADQYGPQGACKADPWWRDCGNGVKYDAACGDPYTIDGKGPSNPVLIHNDPSDANAQYDETYQQDWIRYVVSRYGPANQGGVAVWSLDNEPVWWHSTHRDIHPAYQTYDETIQLGLKYAAAIKAADPSALVSGPVSAGWESVFFSASDLYSGWSTQPWKYWSNPKDQNAHGGLAFTPWYLQQFQNYEKQNGRRLLDYLDLHAYILPDDVTTKKGDAAMEARRLQSTRVLWDPGYVPNRDDMKNAPPPVGGAGRMIPRMKEWVNQYYPDTKTAITEYNWGALDSITGAIAQADILGIFGREGLDLGTLWGDVGNGSPKLTDPVAYAFRMFRNFDGIGGAFGETSVRAVSEDQDKLAIYAAQRSDAALTLMVLNKTASDLSAPVAISNFTPAASANVFRYGQANLNAVAADADVPVNAGSISGTFPAYSITAIVVPAAASTMPVPRPVVSGVANAASYGAIAPGQIAVLFGTNMGPEQFVPAPVVDGIVGTSAGGVRILFDGIPAPVIYAGVTQCAAVVPYLAALQPHTHVQVEYQGNRSEPLEVAVAATAPAIFTANMSGTGQGAVRNEDNVTLNSPENPARVGSIVVIYATGEGATDPPGVDGRLAVSIYPKPLANDCAVEIGGLPAKVEYCGAAPYFTGLLQVNARMAADVQPGDAVPVRITIGGAKSRDGVTIAVR